jgi:hypothetical protein
VFLRKVGEAEHTDARMDIRFKAEYGVCAVPGDGLAEEVRGLRRLRDGSRFQGMPELCGPGEGIGEGAECLSCWSQERRPTSKPRNWC